MTDGSEMKVYIHEDRTNPCFMIPISDNLWLVWHKREEDSAWSIKNTKFIKSMRRKFPAPMTTFDIAEASSKLTEATGLDILLHTGHSYEEIRDIFIKHKQAIAQDEELSEN
jgi:hypothetical protein